MAMERRAYSFQSYAGSIEAVIGLLNKVERNEAFNPTLVRLRLDRAYLSTCGHLKFQSHAGSIEARSDKGWRSREAGVSIPRWFD